METLAFFTLDESSVINLAIFFEFAVPGAWIDVYASDRNTGNRQTVLEIRSSIGDWRMVQGKVNQKFANAKVLLANEVWELIH